MRRLRRFAVPLVALAVLACPGVATADDDGSEAGSPPELVPPPGCDYSAGECPIVIDPDTDRCVVVRARVWVAREGVWTIIDWTWGERPDLDAFLGAANDRFTQWIVDGDTAALNGACGFGRDEDAQPEPGDHADDGSELDDDRPGAEPGDADDQTGEPGDRSDAIGPVAATPAPAGAVAEAPAAADPSAGAAAPAPTSTPARVKGKQAKGVRGKPNRKRPARVRQAQGAPDRDASPGAGAQARLRSTR